MTTNLYQGLKEAPVSIQIVPSGDYKSVDAAISTIVCPDDAVGMKVDIDITAASGGGGVTVTVSAYDPATNAYDVTLLVSALKTGTGHTVLRIDPRIAASANLIAQDGLPGSVQVKCVGSGTRTTLTYSVGVSFHQ